MIVGETTGVTFDAHEFVTSNSRAFTTLLERPAQAVVITHQLCADHFGLHTYKVLRPGTMLSWICFTRADAVRQMEQSSERNTFVAQVA